MKITLNPLIDIRHGEHQRRLPNLILILRPKYYIRGYSIIVQNLYFLWGFTLLLPGFDNSALGSKIDRWIWDYWPQKVQYFQMRFSLRTLIRPTTRKKKLFKKGKEKDTFINQLNLSIFTALLCRSSHILPDMSWSVPHFVFA